LTNLVIVESPTKARTIERYLGEGFTVLASYGHVRDLPKSDFGITVGESANGGNGCSLTYEIPSGSAKQVAALRKAAKGVDEVWLAPDLDREGEAIAWHVAEVLKLDPATTKRVTFDEITKEAIETAFANPRTIDQDLVDAQQARRAVDRIVGYRLSPVLWRTVGSGLSAGRVQSAALRLIVDREDEIRAFVPREYWSMPGRFARPDDPQPTIDTRLYAVAGRRVATPKDLDKAEADDERLAKLLVIDSEELATDLATRARELAYTVGEVKKTARKSRPKPPFTTSTLQQEAANALGFSARQTMAVAQQLYEGVRLGTEGQVGLITYMRTDSVNLSDSALGDLTGYVREHWDHRYQLDKPRRFTTKSQRAQEAHEAIRPTSANRAPDAIARHLKPDQLKLYRLIWKRTVATQMADAVFDRVTADVHGAEIRDEQSTDPSDVDRADGAAPSAFTWRVTGQILTFDGYLALYRSQQDEDDHSDDVVASLPDIQEGESLELREVAPEQHFTTPPPRFTEATLVKTLEELGIGRPSTYASIIGTLAQREYVLIESRRFFPTALGEVVVLFLKAHFGEVVDVQFTARMESTLDEIAEGDERWCATVERFLDEVDRWVEERKPERPRLPLPGDPSCHICGAPMEKVFSGKSKSWFASCSRWPDCEGTLPLNPDGTLGEPEPEPEPDERVRCEICGKPMILKSGRYGRFYGCVDYPSCKGIRNLQQRAIWKDEAGEIHPFRSVTDPTQYMELRTSRYGKEFLGSAGYPEDQFAIWTVPLATPCPECGAPLRPPARNRKEAEAVCAHPDVQHAWAVEGFDLPTVVAMEVVAGVEAFDPDLGGEPLSMPEKVPDPIRLVSKGTRKPPAKKKSRKKVAAKAVAKSTAKKAAKSAARKATKQAGSDT